MATNRKTIRKDPGALAREPTMTPYLVARWLVEHGWTLLYVSRNSVLPSDIWAKGKDQLIALSAGRYSYLSEGQRIIVSLPDTQAALRRLGELTGELSDKRPPGRPTR
jgi:hypothetical protein